MYKRLFWVLRYSGLPYIIRNFSQRNRVTILTFHDIGEDNAEIIFSGLKKRYNIIKLNDYIEAREKDNVQLPRKALIITFDDGHIKNYDLLPVIRKHRIPVTIFLCAGIVNTNRHFWFKYDHQSIVKSKLKRISNIDRLSILSKVGFEQKKEFNNPQALQKWQIEEMIELVNFQSHTMFHPILPKTTIEEARREICDSKMELERNFKLNINAIAYPNGDYSSRDIEFVKMAGYKCGLTVDFGYNSKKTGMFRLKRLGMNDTNNLNEVIVKSCGLWAFFKTRNGKKQSYGLKE